MTHNSNPGTAFEVFCFFPRKGTCPRAVTTGKGRDCRAVLQQAGPKSQTWISIGDTFSM